MTLHDALEKLDSLKAGPVGLTQEEIESCQEESEELARLISAFADDVMKVMDKVAAKLASSKQGAT